MGYQIDIFPPETDYSNQDVLIGLSGGINSAAVVCWLANYPEHLKPKSVHLFYAHFREHSPDTLDFVLAIKAYAETRFKKVVYAQTNNSIIDFFREIKMIPHPMVAPCTRLLKIIPMMEYFNSNKLDVDLVGYIKEERKRYYNMMDKKPSVSKDFPVTHKDNEWCFGFVKSEIGWYPKIYDIKIRGKRVFSHNNCLPCKNMSVEDLKEVEIYYPELHHLAMQLSDELKAFWGRDKDEFENHFNVAYGREDYETNFKRQPCEHCSFD